jgi:UDP-glucose 4-epimerase
MHRMLVTGGAGYIGSYVGAALVARGHQATVLEKLSRKFLDTEDTHG